MASKHNGKHIMVKQKIGNDLYFKYFILLVATVIGNICNANYYADTTISPISDGQTLQLTIPEPPDVNFKVSDYKAHITFSIGDIYRLGVKSGSTDDFVVQIKFTIAEQAGAEYSITLTNNEPEVTFVHNLITPPSALDLFVVQIVSINITTSNSTISSYISNNLQTKIEYIADFGIDVRSEENGDPLSVELNKLSSSTEINNRIQSFSWDNDNTLDFPNYEFQLLRLYNVEEETTTDDKVISTKFDWSRALRIITDRPQKSLTIVVAEGSGYYAWRVRPIGTFYEGGITDTRNYGAWSDAPEETPVDESVLVNSSFASLYNCIFYLNDPENTVNWTYSRIFTEDNRISESMTYANGLSQALQTQSYLPSIDTTIVSQSVMDYSGRPSLQSLPVPVDGKIGRYRNKVLTSENELYTAKNFDDTSKAYRPDLIDTTGYFEYYSDANSDLYIPSSEGYSFSRVLYEDSPLGKVKEQAAPGRIHAFGEQTDSKGRTTRVIYCKPSDEELIRVFGDEALPAKAVLKTITIDANNTASVSYTSTSGKVIATCLVYNNEDSNLMDLDGKVGLQSFTNTDVLKENFRTRGGFVSERKIVLSYPSKIKIRYNLPTGEAAFGCTRVNADCKYVVSFRLHKVGTDSNWYSGDIHLSGISSPDTTWIPSEIELGVGEYIVKKNIRSEANRLSPEIYGKIDESLDPVRNISDVIYGWLDKVSTERGMLTFYRDIQNFSTLVNAESYAQIRDLSFNLGKVYLPDTAYILKTFEDEVLVERGLKVILSPEYDSVNSIYPEMISIQGGCCGDVLIPVVMQTETVCYTDEEIRQNPNLSPNFWGYLRQNLVEPFGEILNISMDNNDPTKTNVMYGYDSVALNKMIYFMLTDKYFTGPTIKVEGETVKLDSTPIVEKDKKVQYSCWELWDCWKGVINSYIDIAANNYTDTLGSVDKGMKDDAAESDNTSQKDGHFDENSDQFGGFFFKLFMKKKLSKMMKEAENIDTDSDDGDAVQFEFKVMEQFLNCAGFRFAGIVEKNGANSYTGILDEDLNKGEFSYTGSNYFHDNITDFSAASYYSDSLFLAYIKNPVYAFKYFQYDNDLSITKTKTRKWAGAEVQMCYEDYFAQGITICDKECGIRSHYNWNAFERLMFYNSIKNLGEPEEIEEIEDPDNFSDSLNAQLHESFNKKRSDCSAKCNDRRAVVDNMVREAFEDNCYVFNGCPADSNVVLEEDIQFIVTNIIDQCISNCDTIFEIAATMSDSFPKITYPVCYRVSNDGTTLIESQGEGYPKLLPDDLKQEYEIINDWAFVFALDDSCSRCKYEDEFSSTLLDDNWFIQDEDNWGQSQVYTDSSLVINTMGATRTEAVYLLRDDMADNFDVSIKIDSMYSQSLRAISGFMVLNQEYRLDSGFVQVGITSENMFFYATDTASIQVTNPVNYYPCYLRLQRTGNEFTASYRYDTVSAWQSITTINAEIPYNSVFGLFVNSGDRLNNAIVSFDDLKGGRKYPNRINSNNDWIGNQEENYPLYNSEGFPKVYSKSDETNLTVQP